MRDGEKVIGTPVEIEGVSFPDKVVGYSKKVQGRKSAFYLVIAKDTDGSNIYIECDKVAPADRRDKITVIDLDRIET